MKFRFQFPTFISLLFLMSCGQIFDSENTSRQREFYSLYNLLNAYYLYADAEIQPASAYQESIPTLMDDIKDPYTDYYNPEQAELLLSQLTTPEVVKLMGIQTQIVQNDSGAALVVYRTFKESPAVDAGILAKDTLLEINGTTLTNDADSLGALFNILVAPDTINLKILRGDSVFSTQVVKAEIVVPTVFVDSIDTDISLIQITSFTDYSFTTPTEPNPKNSEQYGTYDEFFEALQQTADDATTLIDLRGNPGGSISQCANVASEFINEGDTIIVVEDHTSDAKEDEMNRFYIAQTEGFASERQIVLLADEGSASCAEIMIAAIRSNKEVPLVGKTTYGKGIGQSFHYTINSGIAKITSLGIYDKNLVTYHLNGIAPDFEVEGYDSQLAKALELAKPKVANRGLHSARYSVIQTLGDTASRRVEGAFQLDF